MTREADFAYRQAIAIYPSSPETLHRYVELLLNLNRADDARLLVETGLKLNPGDTVLQTLLHDARDFKSKP